jgi:polysaccharide export outer membrane protein
MTFLRCTLLSISLLPALAFGLAQQTTAKPPLPAAKPSAATPITHPANTPQPPHAAANVTPSYIIGPSDSLLITVRGEADLSETVPVRPDGRISMAMVRDIQAAGFTPMQLGDNITALLKQSQFVLDPVVTVTVLAVNSKMVYMIGEINHVGPVNITPGMTVLQAIASAGGLTPYANKKNIYILRGDKQLRIPFDYTKAIKKGDMQGITLVPGDTIVIQ